MPCRRLSFDSFPVWARKVATKKESSLCARDQASRSGWTAYHSSEQRVFKLYPVLSSPSPLSRVEWHDGAPGKPIQIAFIESLNSRRDLALCYTESTAHR